jgi:WD40 repeat protein/serine/threonine protein kinase
VYEVFQAALGCDPAGRAALLDALCGGDASLRAEVERLLTRDAEADGSDFLSPPGRVSDAGPGGPGVFPLPLRVLAAHTHCPHCHSRLGPVDTITGEATCSRCGSILRSGEESMLSGATPAELVNHPDYEIRGRLPQGGMGVVYLAYNRLMARDEVLKLIGPGNIGHPGALDRFLREIRAVARLRHPNIVTAYSAFRCGGSVVFAMEYIDGLDLRRIVKAKGRIPVRQACHFAHQAALGLQHAHEAGLVHRDIKPGNLMLTRQGGRPLVKILDFGLSLATAGGEDPVSDHRGPVAARESETTAALTCTGQMLGTPDFMAPEQIVNAKAADIRSDIYSLGCTLYYMLSGRPPFEAARLSDVLQAHRTKDAPPLSTVQPDVPVELEALVAKMMAKEPGRRFGEPTEVAEALTPFFSTRRPNLAQTPAPGVASAETDQARRARDAVAALPPAIATGSEGDPRRAESIWKGLIEIGEDEDDWYLATTPAKPAGGRSHRFRAAAAVVAVGASFLFGFIIFNPKPKPGDQTGGGRPKSPGPVVDHAAQTGGQPSDRGGVPGGRVNRAETNPGRGDLPKAVTPTADRPAEPEPVVPDRAENDPRTVSGVRVIEIKRADQRKPETTIPARHVALDSGELPRQQRLLTSVTFLPDGWHALTVGRGPDLLLWDLIGGRAFDPFKDDHPDIVYALAVSPDGRFVATGGQDKVRETDFDIRVWEVASGRLVLRLPGHKGIISGLRFTPVGRRLISTSWDHTLCFWNCADWSLEHRTRPYPEPLTCLALSADGRLIATGTSFRKVLLWDAATRELKKPLEAKDQTSRVTALAFLPDGHGLVSAFESGDLIVWDVDRARPHYPRSRAHEGGICMAVCSSDGQLAATGGEVDRAVRLWDVATGRMVREFHFDDTGRVRALAFSADGRTVLAGNWRGTLKLLPVPVPEVWQVEKELPPVSRRRQAAVAIALVSPDGQSILSTSQEGLTLWDRKSGLRIQRVEWAGRSINAVAFSPEGERVLVAQDKTLRLGELGKNSPIREFDGHGDPISDVAFAPSGRLVYLAAGKPDTPRGGSGPALRVWDVERNEEVRTFEGIKGPVVALAVSPDGQRILTRGDETMSLWDALTGREMCRWEGPMGPCGNVAFLPGGRRALSCVKDKTVRLWDLDSGALIRSFPAHAENVGFLAVSPDGRRFLSAESNGHNLWLWDIETGRVIQRLDWGKVSPTRGSITPDGRHAVWGSSDGVVRIYPLAEPS